MDQHKNLHLASQHEPQDRNSKSVKYFVRSDAKIIRLKHLYHRVCEVEFSKPNHALVGNFAVTRRNGSTSSRTDFVSQSLNLSSSEHCLFATLLEGEEFWRFMLLMLNEDGIFWRWKSPYVKGMTCNFLRFDSESKVLRWPERSLGGTGWER